MSSFEITLKEAIRARTTDANLTSATNAFRAFNGVFEGEPDLSVDIFGTAAVLHDFSTLPDERIQIITEILSEELSEINTVILKQRKANNPTRRNGILLRGERTSVEINEFGVRYAVDLIMNHDSGFYLDTANLRRWLCYNADGKRVLNTFAYTGSLGVAALFGGASHVIQQDKSKLFLNIARRSAALNGFPQNTFNTQIQDFFPATASFRKQKREFDILILDPPFFSTTGKGKVSIEHDFLSLINKVRPLVADKGYLILINNALFLSGKQMLSAISPIFSDGYITIQESVPVPASFFGYHEKIGSLLPVDPTPFGHSTKILILKVSKK